MGYNNYLIIYFFILRTHQAPSRISCDKDWLLADDRCYYFSSGIEVTWKEAAMECQSRNSDLLSINDNKESGWVSDQTEEYKTDGWWVGLSYVYPVAGWSWQDTNAPLNNIKWDSEPDNYDDEDCVAVSQWGTYSDEHCVSNYGFVCKLSITRAEANACPVGDRWAMLDDACYYISDPASQSERLSWSGARAKCRSLTPQHVTSSMDLISVTSGDEMMFLQRELPTRANSGMVVPWWTGLNDRDQETVEVWADGSPWNASLTPWDSAPSKGHSATDSTSRDCGVMAVGGVINDLPCSVRAGFICERSANHSSMAIGCPYTWLRGGRSCYLFGHRKAVTWSTARATCVHSNSDLLKLDSVDEQKWIASMNLRGGFSYWTGLNDVATEGDFRWLDGSKPDSQLVMWDHEPSNNEDCAAVTNHGVFMDFSCNQHLPYICKYTTDFGVSCAAGWLSYQGNACYYISGQNDTRMWYEVRQRCTDLAKESDSELQASYLMLTSSDEKVWLVGRLKHIASTKGVWWTGLNDIMVEGLWVWMGSKGIPVKQGLIQWDAEPNNMDGNEDCTILLNGGLFGDVNCARKEFYICEKSVSDAALYSASVPTFFTLLSSLWVTAVYNSVR